MASDIHILSNEMFDRIFSFLSDDKQAIGACRLACRSFKELSSPYLITRVVFARRLKTIARLNEIVEHDYFHKYVTELICDVSYYCERRATDWDTYCQECLNAPQLLRDAEWTQRKLEEQTIWSEIEQLRDDRADTTSARVRSPSCDRDGEHDGVWSRDEIREEIIDDDLSEMVDDDELCEMVNGDDLFDIEDDDYRSEGSGSSSEHEDGALRYYDVAFNLGCHKSFPDYHRLYAAERQINRKGVTEQVVRRALSRLKRLKSIVITDWRALARSDESYCDCAHRLFGNTLAPSLMLSNSANPDMLFEELMWGIEDSEDARIMQFSTGSHFFEDETYDPDDPRAPMGISPHVVDCMFGIVGRIRQLRLSLNINPELLEHMPRDSDDRIQQTLAKASNLEHLTLTIRFPEGARVLRNIDQGKEVFLAWLADQHYSHLKTMDLRGWILPQVLLEEFLARHASTLRAIHFINCHLVGDQVSLAKWASKALDLDGIEISLIPGTHIYYPQGQSDGTIEARPVDTALLPENEPVWLAGRQNFIVRRSFTGSLRNDDPPNRTPWWEKRGRKQS